VSRTTIPILPPKHPRIYVSIESRAGRLTIDGPLTLFRDLMAVVRPSPDAAGQQEEGNTDAVTSCE
jgi:hypothetical protein